LRIAVGRDGGHDIRHPSCSHHHVQVFTDSRETLDEVCLGDAVQSISWLLEEIHMAKGERLKTPGETRFTAPNASGNSPNLAKALGIQSNDSVGFSPSPAPEGNGKSLVERHKGLVQSPRDSEDLLPLPEVHVGGATD
jgi:hypothetical protein